MQVGLCKDLNYGKGNRGHFGRKLMEMPLSRASLLPGGVVNSNCKIIHLYDDLQLMRFDLCRTIYKFDQSQKSLLLNRTALKCQSYYLQDQ